MDGLLWALLVAVAHCAFAHVKKSTTTKKNAVNILVLRVLCALCVCESSSDCEGLSYLGRNNFCFHVCVGRRGCYFLVVTFRAMALFLMDRIQLICEHKVHDAYERG